MRQRFPYDGLSSSRKLAQILGCHGWVNRLYNFGQERKNTNCTTISSTRLPYNYCPSYSWQSFPLFRCHCFPLPLRARLVWEEELRPSSLPWRRAPGVSSTVQHATYHIHTHSRTNSQLVLSPTGKNADAERCFCGNISILSSQRR